MSSIATAVFKATIGLLVNKGRDKAAQKLKDGDVTDQKFRGVIVREIDDIKSKLDGLSRKDLVASISFFEEGIGLLYNVFEERGSKVSTARKQHKQRVMKHFLSSKEWKSLSLLTLMNRLGGHFPTQGRDSKILVEKQQKPLVMKL